MGFCGNFVTLNLELRILLRLFPGFLELEERSFGRVFTAALNPQEVQPFGRPFCNPKKVKSLPTMLLNHRLFQAAPRFVGKSVVGGLSATSRGNRDLLGMTGATDWSVPGCCDLQAHGPKVRASELWSFWFSRPEGSEVFKKQKPLSN